MSGRAEWEKCDSCGQHYPDIYWADDEQWAQVVGDEFGGLRCPECFKAEAWALGLEPVLRFLAPPLCPDSLLYQMRKVNDGFAALWWEVVYATRVDRLVRWLAGKLGG